MMKTIHIGLTNNGMIYASDSQDAMYAYIKSGDSLIKPFFHKIPYQLEAFFNRNPEDVETFFAGFAYWIIRRVRKIKKVNHNYDELFGRLKKISPQLLKELKDAANGIAEKIIRFQKNPPTCVPYKKRAQKKNSKKRHYYATTACAR